MKVVRWRSGYPPMVNEAKLELEKKGTTPYRFDLPPGLYYLLHCRTRTGIQAVINAMTAIVETDTDGVILHPGDSAGILAGTEHWMKVIGDEDVAPVSDTNNLSLCNPRACGNPTSRE